MGINLNGLNSGMADTYSTLLSGAASGNSNTTDTTGTLLTDYASIKNGSYGKMIKAYYTKVADEEGLPSSTRREKKTVEKDAATASAANTAFKSADKLSKMTISEDNKDEVYSAVSSLISDYNEMIKSASKSKNESVQKQAEQLTNAMYNNFKLFGNVGITLNEDRTLSISESSFKKGEIGTIKTLFSGAGSFADKVSSRASAMYRYATDGKTVTAKNYTSTGSYSKTNTADSTINSVT